MRRKLGITIIDLYITKKFLGTFFFSITLILLIAVIFDFSEKIDNFRDHDAKLVDILTKYYLNFMPYFPDGLQNGVYSHYQQRDELQQDPDSLFLLCNHHCHLLFCTDGLCHTGCKPDQAGF